MIMVTWPFTNAQPGQAPLSEAHYARHAVMLQSRVQCEVTNGEEKNGVWKNSGCHTQWFNVFPWKMPRRRAKMQLSTSRARLPASTSEIEPYSGSLLVTSIMRCSAGTSKIKLKNPMFLAVLLCSCQVGGWPSSSWREN